MEKKKIDDGALVRTLVHHPGIIRVSMYRYGTVLETKYPMKDDTEWSDHRVLWHDGDESWEWHGDLEHVSDE